MYPYSRKTVYTNLVLLAAIDCNIMYKVLGDIHNYIAYHGSVLDYLLPAAFEYYSFHFAYYLVHCQVGAMPLNRMIQLHVYIPSPLQNYPQSPPAQNFANCLFVSLFDCYLSHFLPYTGTVPPSPTSSLSQGQSLYTSSPRLNTSFGSPVGQSPSYGATSLMRGGAKICIGSPKQSAQVTESETFVQVGREGSCHGIQCHRRKVYVFLLSLLVCCRCWSSFG